MMERVCRGGGMKGVGLRRFVGSERNTAFGRNGKGKGRVGEMV